LSFSLKIFIVIHYLHDDFAFFFDSVISALGHEVKETKDGGLEISCYSEDGGKKIFKLSKKDYTFIQYLVYGGKLLEQAVV
jgi:hypothetical protein